MEISLVWFDLASFYATRRLGKMCAIFDEVDQLFDFGETLREGRKFSHFLGLCVSRSKNNVARPTKTCKKLALEEACSLHPLHHHPL